MEPVTMTAWNFIAFTWMMLGMGFICGMAALHHKLKKNGMLRSYQGPPFTITKQGAKVDV